MSLTYVITSLLRGDDIEQVEYVISQLKALSSESRPVLLFNGGLNPRGETWIERKYPNARVIELDPPGDWKIREEFHYYDYVCTQLYRHVRTEYYLKMDRDVCVLSRGFDKALVDFMSARPCVSAAGTMARCERNVEMDSLNLFSWLPRPVSFAKTKVLNGGVEIFRTSAMAEIGEMVGEHARHIWQGNLRVGEDDLISLTLTGSGHRIEECPHLLSAGAVDPSRIVRSVYDKQAIDEVRSAFPGRLVVHGFKPFSVFRSFYAALHKEAGPTHSIAARNAPNRKDRWCAKRILAYRTRRLIESMRQVDAGETGVPDTRSRWQHIEPLLFRGADAYGLSGVERCFVQVNDIYAHLPTLYWTTTRQRLRKTLELGTGAGNSTMVLLFAAREIGGHVTTVDIDECAQARQRVQLSGLSDCCTFVTANSLDVEWREPIDHLFIDTLHDYAQVMGELRKYEPYLGKGGVISLHDTTTYPAVWEAVKAYFNGRHEVKITRWFHNNGFALVEKG